MLHHVRRPVDEKNEEFVDAYCDDIRVASALRLLTGPVLENGVVVAALSKRYVTNMLFVADPIKSATWYSERVSPKLRIPIQREQEYEVTYEDGTQTTEVEVVGGVTQCPRFSFLKFMAVSLHYWETVAPLLDGEYFDEDEAKVMLQRAYQLTQGDMRLFRKSVIVEMGSDTLLALKMDKRRR